MKFINHLLGNASETDAKNAQAELEAILVPGESVKRSFRIFRDLLVFTDHRLILINKQGLTGSKVNYHTVFYRSITQFSIETAGTFDADCELKICISGSHEPISKQFAKGTDVIGIQKLLAYAVFGNNLPTPPTTLPENEFPNLGLTPEDIGETRTVKTTTPPPLPATDWEAIDEAK